MFANPARLAIPLRLPRRLRRPAREDDGLAAGLRDLLCRGLAECVRAHRHGLGELAVAEDLDLVAAPLDDTLLAKGGLVDLGAGREDFEIADVDLGGPRRERRVEAALGEAALHRRLSALEVRLEAARPGVLPLLATAGGLAEAASDAAP